MMRLASGAIEGRTGDEETRCVMCRAAALVEPALATYGRVDVLFNLAAISYLDWLEDLTDEE